MGTKPLETLRTYSLCPSSNLSIEQLLGKTGTGLRSKISGPGRVLGSSNSSVSSGVPLAQAVPSLGLPSQALPPRAVFGDDAVPLVLLGALGVIGQGARVNLRDIPWSMQSLKWSGNPLCWQHGREPRGSPEVEEFSCQHLVLCGHAGSGFGLWLTRFGVCVGLCIPSWRWSRCWCRGGSPGLGWCCALEHLEVQ